MSCAILTIYNAKQCHCLDSLKHLGERNVRMCCSVLLHIVCTACRSISVQILTFCCLQCCFRQAASSIVEASCHTASSAAQVRSTRHFSTQSVSRINLMLRVLLFALLVWW